MSGPEFNDYASLPSTQGPYPTSSTETTPPSNAGTGLPSGVSTIEESKQVIIELPPSAAMPQLTMYNSNSASMLSVAVDNTSDRSATDALLLRMRNRTQELTNDVLDAWSKSLEEQAEIMRRKIKDPFYQRQVEIKLTGNDGTITETVVRDKPIILDLTDKLQTYFNSNPSKDQGPANIDVSTVVSVMMVGSVMVVGIDPVVHGASNSPLQSIDTLVSNIQPMIPPNVLLTDAVMTINLLVMPMLYQVAMDGAADSLKGKGKPDLGQSAKRFAEEVIKMTTTPNLVLVNFVDKMENANKLSPDQRDKMAAIIKLVLSVVALAYIYKAEAGGFTSKEVMDRFMGMLNGTVPLKEGDPQGMLVKIIKAQFQILSPEEKVKALEAIMTYLDSKPKMDGMLDPYKVLSQTFESAAYQPEGGFDPLFV